MRQYGLHFKVGEIPSSMKKVYGCDEIPQVGIDADIIMEGGLQVQNIVVIGLCIQIRDGHIKVEVLEKIQITLTVVIHRSFP